MMVVHHHPLAVIGIDIHLLHLRNFGKAAKHSNKLAWRCGLTPYHLAPGSSVVIVAELGVKGCFLACFGYRVGAAPYVANRIYAAGQDT